MKRGIVWAVLLSLVGIGGVWSVHASSFNSTNFSINGNLGDSAAGGQSSTNYQLTSAAGESIAGRTSSNSYKLGQGYIPTLEQSLQLNVQPGSQGLYVPFEEGTGTVLYDNSINTTSGAFVGAPQWTTGKVGGGLTTDSTHYAGFEKSAAITPTSAITLETWIKPSNLGSTSSQKILSSTEGGGVGVYLTGVSSDVCSALKICFVIRIGGSYSSVEVDKSTYLSNGTWAHIAAAYNGSTMKLYVDGVERATANVTGSISYHATAPLCIGAEAQTTSCSGTTYAGDVDEVKLFSRGLTAKEVTAEYSAQNAGVPSGLSLNNITAGVSQTATFDASILTDSPGYTLAINQNNNLQTGSNGITPDFAQNFNSFGDGTTLTTGNTGFDNISMSGTGTFTSSTSSPIQGTFGRFQTTTSSTDAARKDYTSTSSRYYRFYMRLSAIPGATETIFNLRDNTTGVVSALRIQSDGTFQLRNGSITVDTSTTALSANQWVRVEMFYNAASSTQTVRLFFDGDVNNETPTETMSGAATNGATVDANFGLITAQASQTLDMDEIATGTTGWIGPTGGHNIPAVSGSIASPVSWSEGTTKGLGFTLYGTNATAIPGTWNSGGSYAALPSSSTTFYTRTGFNGGSKDILNMRLRVDTAVTQAVGDYTNQLTITGTMTP